MYNFVTSPNLANIWKGSKLFKTSLGRSITKKSGEDKRKMEINNKDVFVKFYLEKKNKVPYLVGNIGQLNFFKDHYLKNDDITIFYSDKEFNFEHNEEKLKKEGVNSYIGSFIKEIEEKYSDELVDVKPIDVTKEGDPRNLFKNPGTASYEDLKAYLKEKNKK